MESWVGEEDEVCYCSQRAPTVLLLGMQATKHLNSYSETEGSDREQHSSRVVVPFKIRKKKKAMEMWNALFQ